MTIPTQLVLQALVESDEAYGAQLGAQSHLPAAPSTRSWPNSKVSTGWMSRWEDVDPATEGRPARALRLTAEGRAQARAALARAAGQVQLSPVPDDAERLMSTARPTVGRFGCQRRTLLLPPGAIRRRSATSWSPSLGHVGPQQAAPRVGPGLGPRPPSRAGGVRQLDVPHSPLWCRVHLHHRWHADAPSRARGTGTAAPTAWTTTGRPTAAAAPAGPTGSRCPSQLTVCRVRTALSNDPPVPGRPTPHDEHAGWCSAPSGPSARVESSYRPLRDGGSVRACP